MILMTSVAIKKIDYYGYFKKTIPSISKFLFNYYPPYRGVILKS